MRLTPNKNLTPVLTKDAYCWTFWDLQEFMRGLSW
jgi:hypothetical protein